MNIYFLVEGRRTEKKVYPKWVSYLLPELREIDDPFRVDKNNFYLFNGNGYPSLLDNHLRNAIEDIETIGKYDYLVLCLDSDEVTAAERKAEVDDFVNKNKLQPQSAALIVIVQQRCIESWFLGNRRIFSRTPQSEKLRRYYQFYNIYDNDPELMGKTDDFDRCASFHEDYLSELFVEKNIRYSKKYPGEVLQEYYLNELIDRTKTTRHLNSFAYFTEFCANVKQRLVPPTN